MSKNEDELEFQLKHATKFYYERQYQFHPRKNFRADFLVRDYESVLGKNLDRETLHAKLRAGPKLLVEIDGAKYGKPGSHQRVDGIDYDCRRAAEAILLGFKVLRVSSRMVRDGTALQCIEFIFNGRYDPAAKAIAYPKKGIKR